MEAAIAVRARPGLQTPPKQRDGSARATAGRILRGNSGGGRPGHALHAARAGAHQERQHLRSSAEVFFGRGFSFAAIILFPASGLTCRICEESKRERCGAGVFRSPFWTILIFFNDFCRV